MSDLQVELLRAGLVTQKQYGRQKLQEQRREAKAKQKMLRVVQDNSASFHSLRSLMDHVKKELRRDPTTANVRALTRQAHHVADQLNLNKKKRSKMHAFLAKVAEGLVSRMPEDRLSFLNEVFLTLDPKLVNEE